MKGKKLVSILTAGALAATMAMPVMAADGGTIDVEVTTKTGILRVEVPTTLAIAVDQFETTDAGSQVYSEEFTIANKSEVNVKVNVTSTATVGSAVTLAAKRADVATAAGANGTAWLAVAASLDGTDYEATKDLSKLNEASANVTTFAKNGTATTAAQTFYLKKGTANTAAYKLLKPEADGKNNNVSYAQFYKLTEIATQPTNDTELQTAVNASDVKAAEIYAYGEMTKESIGADAAFRYIGALSSNKEVWDASDISKINIAYTIQGIPQSTYDAADGEGITYGLYKEKLAAKYSVEAGKYYVTVDGRTGFAAAPSSLSIGGVDKTVDTDYTYHKNGWIELKAAPTDGDTILLVVNGTTYKVTVPTS